jgi:hypothetical protein
MSAPSPRASCPRRRTLRTAADRPPDLESQLELEFGLDLPLERSPQPARRPRLPRLKLLSLAYSVPPAVGMFFLAPLVFSTEFVAGDSESIPQLGPVSWASAERLLALAVGGTIPPSQGGGGADAPQGDAAAPATDASPAARQALVAAPGAAPDADLAPTAPPPPVGTIQASIAAGIPVDDPYAAQQVGPGDSLDDSWRDGYYPTLNDMMFLGDRESPRSRTPEPAGPDGYLLNTMGLRTLDPYGPSFYSENAALFAPVDRVLGFFSPHEALVWETETLQRTSIAADASLGNLGLTRSFVPDRAHLKAGLLYLDVLYLRTELLYSDYNGDQQFAEGAEPGWLSAISLGFRTYLRLTEQFYLAAVANLAYLPQENRLGYSVGGLGLGPFANLIINFERRIAEWDLRVFNHFTGTHRSYIIFDGLGEEASQAAGRYRFGIDGGARSGRSGPFFSEDYVSFTNTIGASASRLLGDWRLFSYAQHQDFWRTFDFTDHSRRDSAGFLLGYNGSRIPFNPYFAYDVYSDDGLESFYHRARVGANGRITQNLRISAMAGYGWTTNFNPDTESYLWRIGLDHDLSERTTHGIYAGQDFATNEFVNETSLAQYVGYYINHRVSRDLYAGGYAQLSEEEPLGSPDNRRRRQSLGLNLSYRPLDFTNIYARGAYERSEYSDILFIDETYLLRIGVDQRIWSRTSASLFYQFEENVSRFNEHLYYLSLTRYF